MIRQGPVKVDRLRRASPATDKILFSVAPSLARSSFSNIPHSVGRNYDLRPMRLARFARAA